ncbi:MAG: amidohydrolase [Bacteroidetes bacterium]|nr:amidohydrolase [Bacteroidota bacterium]
MIIPSVFGQKKNVDLIISDAMIYTLDAADSKAQCLAVDHGSILDLGSQKEIMEEYSSDKVINVNGAFVYPGFIDAHSHFTGLAQFLRYADLNAAESFDEVISILEDYHKSYPGRWILGRGWDQNKWKNKEFPVNNLLDSLFPGIPVVLTRVDGHAVLANSTAISKAGITPPYTKGEVILSKGIATGVFLERTADRIKESIPLPSSEEIKILLLKAAALCQQAGLTGVNDAGIDKPMILFLDSLQKSGSLKIRIDAMINPTNENMDYFMGGKFQSSDWLRVGSVKIYADGALGSRGACLLQPYSDEPESNGIIVTGKDEMRSICNRAFMSGFQVNTHAIGDSAVRLVLNTYGEFLKGKNDRRWRIEHSQVVDENDFDLFGKYSVIPSIQSTHATSDMAWAVLRLGKKRLINAYSYHRLMDENGWIPNGTDFPVENISPLLTYYAAVGRMDLQGNPEGGFQPENALSRSDALKSITIWAAKAAFLENSRGSLEKGKLADLVILDKDLLQVPVSDIPKVKVIMTIINGEVVYQK